MKGMTGLAPVTGLTQPRSTTRCVTFGLTTVSCTRTWPYNADLSQHPLALTTDSAVCAALGARVMGLGETRRKVATSQAVGGKDESRPENVPSCPPRLFLELKTPGI